ncbi:MAG: dioxygenase [Candidatus Sericytochromatia bacterium]|nr:dioxygenase [Candidatus Sericytochromatia bacterium]
MNKSKRLPAFFIPHGGGPCFFMDWTMGPADTWDGLAAWLRQMADQVGQRPSAILVISAHWETPAVTITGHARPELIYDYYGFPEHTYHLTYPAPGAPALAKQIQTLLNAADIPAQVDAERGYDHGVFIPLKLIYPDAEIPVLQISLRADLDPAFHHQLGQALAPLREQGVLLIGSGMSFHNLRVFGRDVRPQAREFDTWLSQAVAQTSTDRAEQLNAWGQAPSGRFSHPREEHLLPLMVIAGAAEQEPGKKVFEGEIMGSVISAFQFGAA